MASRSAACDDAPGTLVSRAGWTPPALRVASVSKRFGSRLAVDGVDLELGAGETLVLLGPNGAGKTTLLQLCAGVLAPDAGSVVVAALPARDPRARRAIGLAPQTLAIYPRLTVRENLAFFAQVFGVARAERAARVAHGLELSGLGARAEERAALLSGGMQRRLNFACAVVHAPRLLLLDEPTAGVDPQSRALLHAAIDAQRRAGVALICATHQLDEADRFGARVVVMNRGRVCADGSAEALKRSLGAPDLQDVVLQLTGGEGGT